MRGSDEATASAFVLIVDDEPNIRKVLGALLEQAGYSVACATGGAEALDLVRAHDPDLVISDLKMPGMDGLELLRLLREGFPEIPVVLLTAHGTVETAVEAMRHGAHDFLTKPFDQARVLEIVSKAARQARSVRREFQGPAGSAEPTGLLGRSPAIESLRSLVNRVAPSSSTVLVTGETGTGKELVAQALHRLSPRRGAPFVAINCGALPEGLVEAELFGHERGAFTGAERARPGRFELAHGGTLFLDEIGELPASTQVKLLRVLQDGQVNRVGSIAPRHVDVRVIAATNRDLQKDVEDGLFRSDLLFRLRVVEIVIPPLRERAEDIPLLIDFFLDKHARRLDRPRPTLGAEAMAALGIPHWPGNVRELENAIERAMLLAAGPVLTPADFGLGLPGSGSLPSRPSAAAVSVKSAARAAAAETERRLIRAALDATGGNVTRAAERLGLSRRGLQIKLKELGLGSGR